jgi:hypothetical protein
MAGLADATNNKRSSVRGRRKSRPRSRLDPPASPTKRKRTLGLSSSSSSSSSSRGSSRLSSASLPHIRGCAHHGRQLCPLCTPGHDVLLTRAVGRWLYRRASRAFQGWLAGAKGISGRRTQVVYVLHRWRNPAPHEAFDGWRFMAAKQRRLKAVVQRVLKGWTNQTLAFAFRRWVNLLGNSARVLAKAMAILKGDPRQYCIGRWRAAVAARKSAVNGLQKLCKPEVMTFLEDLGGRCYSRQSTVSTHWAPGESRQGSRPGRGGGGSSQSLRPLSVGSRGIDAKLLHHQEATAAAACSGSRSPPWAALPGEFSAGGSSAPSSMRSSSVASSDASRISRGTNPSLLMAVDAHVGRGGGSRDNSSRHSSRRSSRAGTPLMWGQFEVDVAAAGYFEAGWIRGSPPVSLNPVPTPPLPVDTCRVTLRT